MSFGSFMKSIRGDKVVWAIVILLSVFSILAVYSSTGTLAYKYKQGNTEYYLLKHLSIMLFGLVLMYVFHRINFKLFGKYSFIFLFVAICLLIATFFVGTSINDAKRWVTLPLINITFQPSDFAKLAILIFLAHVMSKFKDNLNDLVFNAFFLLLPILLVIMLILPSNFSTAAIIGVSCFIVLFVGRMNPKQLLIVAGSAIVVACIFLVLMKAFPDFGRDQTWKKRIEAFLGDDPDARYQADQAKIAIAKGSIFGQQPGHSIQKNFLPQPYSDFIYAIIIEEYGLIGGIIMVFLYLILLFRGASIATRTQSRFGALLTFGLTFSLVLQGTVNMLVAVGLLPVTGQPLPLVSMGGTSLWFTSISIGIILSVSSSLEPETHKDTRYAEA